MSPPPELEDELEDELEELLELEDELDELELELLDELELLLDDELLDDELLGSPELVPLPPQATSAAEMNPKARDFPALNEKESGLLIVIMSAC